jgi:hypothetical protein
MLKLAQGKTRPACKAGGIIIALALVFSLTLSLVLLATDEASAATPGAHLLFPGEQFSVGSSPISVAWADLNGDGRVDTVTANIGSNNVSVLLGNGDGTFAAQATFAVGSFPVSCSTPGKMGQLEDIT